MDLIEHLKKEVVQRNSEKKFGILGRKCATILRNYEVNLDGFSKEEISNCGVLRQVVNYYSYKGVNKKKVYPKYNKELNCYYVTEEFFLETRKEYGFKTKTYKEKRAQFLSGKLSEETGKTIKIEYNPMRSKETFNKTEIKFKDKVLETGEDCRDRLLELIVNLRKTHIREEYLKQNQRSIMGRELRELNIANLKNRDNIEKDFVRIWKLVNHFYRLKEAKEYLDNETIDDITDNYSDKLIELIEITPELVKPFISILKQLKLKNNEDELDVAV